MHKQRVRRVGFELWIAENHNFRRFFARFCGKTIKSALLFVRFDKSFRDYSTVLCGEIKNPVEYLFVPLQLISGKSLCNQTENAPCNADKQRARSIFMLFLCLKGGFLQNNNSKQRIKINICRNIADTTRGTYTPSRSCVGYRHDR